MSARTTRHGYAMMLVLVFIVLFLALSAIAYRRTGAVLRIESARSLQIQRDEGSIHAVANALALLQTGLPPSDPYVCGVTINTSTGPRSFTVTLASEGVAKWSVRSTPTQPNATPQPMPGSFAPQ